MIHIIFILLKLFNDPSCPMDGGIVILEETTPIRIEMFHLSDHSEKLSVDWHRPSKMILIYMEASAFVILLSLLLLYPPSFIRGFPLICPPSVLPQFSQKSHLVFNIPLSPEMSGSVQLMVAGDRSCSAML